MPLDGGLSAQLASAGYEPGGALWTAAALVDAPDALVAAHGAFLAAGARVLLTASYQASRRGFASRGLSDAEADGLIGRSVRLARAAVAARPSPREPVWVAGSLGPYGAALGGGAEYRGRYGVGTREVERFHRPRLGALAAAGPDLIALETLPDQDEGAVLLRMVPDLGIPVWVSWTIEGDRTRDGRPLAEAFALAAGVPGVVAVGVNCCRPEDVGPAVESAAAVTGLPVVAYPNSGEVWDPVRGRWTGAPTPSAEMVGRWVAAGARLIGGCCRVNAARLAPVVAAVRAAAREGREAEPGHG
ncbi:homocysteine S-methyltransferase [Streptomyces sp. ST2-7A]|uniref:homocysteine S-methyltransferase n=1 Tax=Streptomyces sp. ST2-7A TaxID=2907214 RepID=UPI001F3ACD0A|nr:homocysteine S-methyltransferase [Streptomyces sp. ST2-7A]MCE7080389.1 homocysteine S-methyltransferase [Streptomyces sp. ST2-7A]